MGLIFGTVTLALGLLSLLVLMLRAGRRSDRAALQAQLDMMAAAIDPEFRKPD